MDDLFVFINLNVFNKTLTTFLITNMLFYLITNQSIQLHIQEKSLGKGLYKSQNDHFNGDNISY